MKTHKILAFALSIILAATLCACGQTSKNDKFYDESDTIQVTDAAGRKVSFTEPVKTVATSWGGSVDPYLFALGVTDRLVATNAKNDFHQIMISDMENMKSVGRWVVDKEALADLKPDLFIHGMAGVEYLNDANKVGVRSIGLGFNSFSDITDSMVLLGKVFGVEKRADEVNTYLNSIENLIKEHTKNIDDSDKPVVLVMGDETGTVSSNIYDTIEAMITLAGGKSCVPEEMTKSTEMTNVGLETIFKWNPDVFFLESYYGELTVEQIMNDKTWASMKSVQTNNVYAIPSKVDCWGDATPSCYLGALYMSMQMFPELYSDVDFENTVIDFYKNVYQIDITREMIGF